MEQSSRNLRQAAGVFFAWSLASFAFWAITFIFDPIRLSFHLTQAETGSLLTVVLVSRLIGALCFGLAAEEVGYHRPMLVAIVICSLAGASAAVVSSFTQLMAARAVFGIGLGGVWVAGMPLALAHVPERARGIGAGLLQGGWNWGYLLAAVMDAFIMTPSAFPTVSWRYMLALSIGALISIPVIGFKDTSRSHVMRKSGSPFGKMHKEVRTSLLKTFAHTIFVLTVLMSFYYTLTSFFVTFLKGAGFRPLWPVVLLNAGGIAGGIIAGKACSAWGGHRVTVTIALLLTVIALPLFLSVGISTIRYAGALFTGFTGFGMWGVIPKYLADRFPDNFRALGPGIAYHAGILIASPVPLFVGYLFDRGMQLSLAISLPAVITAVCGILAIWSGPEQWVAPQREAVLSEALDK